MPSTMPDALPLTRPLRAPRPARPITGGLVNRLLNELGRRGAAPLADLHILILGFDGSELVGMCEYLRRKGAQSLSTSATWRALAQDIAGCRRFGAVIVNMDAFPDTETAVDTLMAFRRACPRITVLMVSSRVSKSDLGSERRAIGDATLRAPFTQARFAAALAAAMENNRALSG